MQNFIILEVTRNAQGNIAVYPSARETRNAADKKYYEILERAADSQSPVHGAALLNWDCYELEHKYYEHTPEPTPEPEPETTE
jgi:hypothetical protein